MDQGSSFKTAFASGLKEDLESFLETRLAVLEATLHSCMDTLLWDPDLFERNLDQGMGEEGQALRLYQAIGHCERVTSTLDSAVHIAIEEAAYSMPRSILFESRGRAAGATRLREVEAWLVPLLSLLFQKLAALLEEGSRFEITISEDRAGSCLRLGLEGLHPETLEGALVIGEKTLLPLLAKTLGLVPETVQEGQDDVLQLLIPLPMSVYVGD